MPRIAIAAIGAGLLLGCGLLFGSSSAGVAAEGATGAVAGPWQPLHAGSRIRLVGVSGTAAGEVNGGVEIELADGWKTYWRMPGESGVPPQFEWQGSGNVASVVVKYPAPLRLPEAGGDAIGYKKHVLFPFAAKAAQTGKPLQIKLEAEFGICKDICVPIQTSLALEIPASPKTAALPQALADAVRAVPAPPSTGASDRPALLSTAAHLEGDKPRLVLDARFSGATNAADVFVEAPESIFVPLAKQTAQKPDGTLTFTISLPAATAQDLKGKALTVTLVGDKGATEVQWQLP